MGTALELSDPAPDFANLARAFGWYAEGPVSEGSALREAVERAVRVIEEEGTPALVDAVTRYR
jgi:thiamine pyrophosphate-dependent acetolactate synthase large subunit-like protein